MKRIFDSLKATFNDFDCESFTEDMALGEIPDWDSMNSMNFIAELEETYKADLSDVMLKESHTVSDIVKILQSKGIVLIK